MLVYWPVYSFDFVSYDDGFQVFQNPIVLRGISVESIFDALTYFDYQCLQTCTYSPVTMLSLMVDREIYGLDAGGFHLTNLFLHSANSILLFFALRALTASVWPSFAVTVLFAVHPLHVESVAWVSGRKDLLSTLFWFLTLLAYARFAKRGGRWNLALVNLAFVTGLLAKPMLITVPFLLLVLDFWPLQRVRLTAGDRASASARKQMAALVIEKLTMFVASAFAALAVFSRARGGMLGSGVALSSADRVGNAVVGYGAYLWDMIYPVGLAHLYPLSSSGQPVVLILAAAVTLAIVTVAALRNVSKRPYLLAGWLWYLGTLVPVIGLVQMGAHSRADRYTYVSLVGVFIMVVWFVKERCEDSPSRSRLAALGFGLIALLFGLTAFTQSGHWKNSESLYTRAIEVTEGNYLAHYNLGTVRWFEHNIEEAEREFRAALAIAPTHPESRNNLGVILMAKSNYAEALPHFTAIAEQRSRNVIALCNVAAALRGLGRESEALDYIERARPVDPARLCVKILDDYGQRQPANRLGIRAR